MISPCGRPSPPECATGQRGGVGERLRSVSETSSAVSGQRRQISGVIVVPLDDGDRANRDHQCGWAFDVVRRAVGSSGCMSVRWCPQTAWAMASGQTGRQRQRSSLRRSGHSGKLPWIACRGRSRSTPAAATTSSSSCASRFPMLIRRFRAHGVSGHPIGSLVRIRARVRRLALPS